MDVYVAPGSAIAGAPADNPAPPASPGYPGGEPDPIARVRTYRFRLSLTEIELTDNRVSLKLTEEADRTLRLGIELIGRLCHSLDARLSRRYDASVIM